MPNISTVLFDVGGVLLNDGWGHVTRRAAADHFDLDFDEIESHHAPLADALDTGQISVNDYINKAIFYKERSFSKSDFYQFMQDQSTANPETIALASALAAQNKYFMATINNESPELNQFRIEKFNLAPIFKAFFSSGFMGVKKPDSTIYERVLHILQVKAASTVFIDDREDNLMAPRQLKMNTIHFQSRAQLQAELSELGITF